MSTLMCLALAIHFEARGESPDGKRMVGEVVVNRSNTDGFPSTICGVVYSKSKDGKSCAFSWTCDGKSDLPNLKKPEEIKSWKESERIAEEILDGKNLMGTDALYFHNSNTKKPRSWGKRKLLGRVGDHIFYR